MQLSSTMYGSSNATATAFGSYSHAGNGTTLGASGSGDATHLGIVSSGRANSNLALASQQPPTSGVTGRQPEGNGLSHRQLSNPNPVSQGAEMGPPASSGGPSNNTHAGSMPPEDSAWTAPPPR